MKSYESKPVESMDSIDTTSEKENKQVNADSDVSVTDDVAVAPQDLGEPDMAAIDDDAGASISDERRYRFAPPSGEQLWMAVAFGGVILLGAILRFWGLGDKPLHHDESLHAYFSLQLMHNNMENWLACINAPVNVCYRYDPLTHGPFQFHIIALVYKISQLLGVYEQGVNTVTVRIAAATLGTVIVGLPYFLRASIGRIGAWLACFLLAISPSMVYYSRFAREDIYMACFTMLLVVAIMRYIHTRKAGWLITAALAFTLSYATKEATFLTIAVFGSFLGALLVWELGIRWPLAIKRANVSAARFLPRTGAPVALLAYFVVLGIAAKWFFGFLKALSITITSTPANTQNADVYVQHLKSTTETVVLPLLGVLLAGVALFILLREQYGRQPAPGRHGLARRIDPARQPLLDTILSMPWTHWFFALVISWFLFLLLFTALFTYVPHGIGDGIWQGLYYWLQQQQVARGGQPWYYYFLLIPLYEQIGLVFALVGIARCVLHPTRFRLFLAYWFVGNVFIYSWAGEKMPWLMIHMTMPMLLLAALGLEPAVTLVFTTVKARLVQSTHAISIAHVEAMDPLTPVTPLALRGRFALAGAITTVVVAGLLLLPTLQNMFQVTYVHYADAPHEMMIYVQTATDINIVMDKVEMLDKKYYGGSHQLPIGITDDATWPYAWYMRDYKNVCYRFPTGCPTVAKTMPVIITGGDNLPEMQFQYSKNYAYHQYHLRTQWDQGYMPPPCIRSKTNTCSDPQPYTGVGPWLWLSYGDNPPSHAQFDLGRAVSNIWQWWRERKAFGSTEGTYDMGLFIRNGLAVNP
ncbi:MAG: hypothetical protein PVSMB5_21930 [Ktedonobacteraceae bacterium]